MSTSLGIWKRETAVLQDFSTRLNDRLDVVNGHLHLEKGMFSRFPGVWTLQQPSELAAHLERLVAITGRDCFQFLQASWNDRPEFYEKVADFNRELKELSTLLSDLAGVFREHDLDHSTYAENYSRIFQEAYSLSQKVKKYKSTLEKPPLDQRPIKHVTYDERTDIRSIKCFSSKRVPAAETVTAAKKALVLAQDSSSLLKKCLNIFLGIILSVPASLLTALKIILWNPLEWLFRGEIRTSLPINLLYQMIDCDHTHMRAYQVFTTQLLRRPHITEEVVEAFEQLAPHADLLDLRNAVLAAEDIMELAPFIEEDEGEGAIPVDTYLGIVSKLFKECNSQIQAISLDSLRNLYETDCSIYQYVKEKKSVSDFIEEGYVNPSNHQIKRKMNLQPPHKVHPYIAPKNVQRLIQAAVSSPTCHEIQLNSALTEIPFVQNFLKEHSYQLEKDNGLEKIYRRSV